MKNVAHDCASKELGLADNCRATRVKRNANNGEISPLAPARLRSRINRRRMVNAAAACLKYRAMARLYEIGPF
jgi:hypothetical protein